MTATASPVARDLAPLPERVWSGTWARVLGRRWDLTVEGRASATIEWPSVFSAKAHAATAGATWDVARKGVLTRHILVSQPGSAVPAATLTQRWRRGELESRIGPRAEWRSRNFFGTRWGFAGADGANLLEFERKTFVIYPKAVVTASHVALRRPDLALLVVLGWYLIVMSWRDTAHHG